METENKLGIWLDHQSAKVITYSPETMETFSINSAITNELKQQSLNKSEHGIHNKEQQFQANFFKELADIIIHFSEVVLFGPTTAKNELFNMLQSDKNFEAIQISTENADKLDEPQQHAFVREYFNRTN